jgi:hypothetical protein
MRFYSIVWFGLVWFGLVIIVGLGTEQGIFI